MTKKFNRNAEILSRDFGLSKNDARRILANCHNDVSLAKATLESNSQWTLTSTLNQSSLNQVAKDDSHTIQNDELLHPCMIQYGGCKYGEKCKYSTLPANTCLAHIHGGCAFGASCRNQHTIDGVDSKLWFPEENVVTRFSAAGERMFLVEEPQKTKPVPEKFVAADPTGCLPEIRGPAPFLEKTAAHVTKPNQTGIIPTIGLKQSKEESVFICTPDQRQTHPCIAQKGSCRFGEMCLYRSLPSDTCVFWLNRKCRFNENTCKYRHSKEFREDVPECIRVILDATEPAVEMIPASSSEGSVAPPKTRKEPSMENPQLMRLVDVFPNIESAILGELLLRNDGNLHASAEDAYKLVSTNDSHNDEYNSVLQNENENRSMQLISIITLFPTLHEKEIEGIFKKSAYDFYATCRTLSMRHDILSSDLDPKNNWTPRVAAMAADRLRYKNILSIYEDILDPEIIKDVWDRWNSDPYLVYEKLDELVSALHLHDENSWLDVDRTPLMVENSSTTLVPTENTGAYCNNHKKVSSQRKKKARNTSLLPSDSRGWARLREEAYAAEAMRRTMLRLSIEAIGHGDYQNSKLLARRAHELHLLYNERNAQARTVLEKAQDQNLKFLDLHGFHVDEAIDVLMRRINRCRALGRKYLTVVTGVGVHCQHGGSKIHKRLLEMFEGKYEEVAGSRIVTMGRGVFELEISSL